MFKDNNTIVFIGDSVTEACRDHNDENSLGVGFVKRINDYLQKKYSDKSFKVYNKGISGNRCFHILERYQKDVLEYKPNIVFLSCGVNDAWHKYSKINPIETPDSVYFETLEKVVKGIIDNNIELIIIESLLLNEPDFVIEIKEEFEGKMIALENLAKKYNLKYVKLVKKMLQHAKNHGSANVAADGIHPTQFGYDLISEEIIKQLEI